MRSDWGVMAREYLSERRGLVLFIQLVDSRHLPTALDKQLNDWLIVNEKKHIVVATKLDKLLSNQLQKQILQIRKTLPESKILTYSASTGKGRDELWAEIVSGLKKN